MKTIWMPNAEQDRLEIFNFVSRNNPHAAVRLDIQFEQTAASLVDLPYRGRIGPIPNTREILPHPNYRLLYEVRDEIIYIIALVHAAREWPPKTD